MARSARSPPWKRSNPRKRAGKASTHLTPAQKSAAKAGARRAGRRYPNLVDNMRVAAKANKMAKKKRTAKRKANRKATGRTTAATRKSPRKRSAKAREKDPKGGLTLAGRKAFARKQGAHLRPGAAGSPSSSERSL